MLFLVRAMRGKILAMLALIRIFWDICRLRAGPQDLPSGRNLLISAVLAGILVDSFASSILMTKFSGLEIATIVATYNIVLLASVYLLLKFIGYQERAMQTMIAIAGAGLMISLVLLPGLITADLAEPETKSFALFILIDNIWRIAVNAHIFRHALSVSLLMAMIISVSYLLFGVLVADFLLPTESNP